MVSILTDCNALPGFFGTGLGMEPGDFSSVLGIYHAVTKSCNCEILNQASWQ